MAQGESMTYFGIAIDGEYQFRGHVSFGDGQGFGGSRNLSVQEVKERVKRGVVSCCTPDQKSILDELGRQHEIEVSTSDAPPEAVLSPGPNSTRVIVVDVLGLPSLADQRPYSSREVAGATFKFYELVDI